MKYIKPTTEIIRLNLTSNIMEDLIITGSKPETASPDINPNESRKNFIFFDDEDTDTPQNTTAHKSIWDE